MRTYALAIHQNGEVLVEGDFDEDEVEELVRDNSPTSFDAPPSTIIVEALLAGGKLDRDGWGIRISVSA